jgi:glucose-1-phosphate cytidylyltransferase
MRVVILAGGMGTRLAEETAVLPKPMVSVGGRPVLWHIMKYYACFGFNEFVIALGYKADVIKRYFLNYCSQAGDLEIDLVGSDATICSSEKEDWVVHLVDTGLRTMTGGRLRRLKPWLDDGTFLLTYGDGLSDVDLRVVNEFHGANHKLATITAVRPPGRFGELGLDKETVNHFSEKPLNGDGWINGGYMVLEPQVLEYFHSDEDILERSGLEVLAQQGELVAYRHSGFWQCMDTLNEKRQLDQLCESGNAPWMIWKQ